MFVRTECDNDGTCNDGFGIASNWCASSCKTVARAAPINTLLFIFINISFTVLYILVVVVYV